MISRSDGHDLPEEKFKEQDVDVVDRVDSKAGFSDADVTGGNGSIFISSIRKDEPIVNRRELWSYYRAFSSSFIRRNSNSTKTPFFTSLL